ncbi:hypothetical protein [Nannocystis pusilla]|uniref:hypothetical protein n=1 Tax=Nannocystis pusilla TaxID=889268 RepID=UPI003B810F42
MELVHAESLARPRWPLAEMRVRDELRALGMTVTEARTRSTDDGAMAALLAEHAAVAAVQISRTSDRGEVTLWFAEPVSRRVSLALEDRGTRGTPAPTRRPGDPARARRARRRRWQSSHGRASGDARAGRARRTRRR